MSQEEKVTVGIDLGTTNSCVGVIRNGRVEIIANKQGHRITPSFVAFTDTERLIGDAAKAQSSWNPENTVFDVKRLIGRKYDDQDAQKSMDRWPFTVENDAGAPKVAVTFKGERKLFSPEEISAMVLSEMKDIAEGFVGHTIHDAVITVPAYFNDSQRQATLDAGVIAGLNVLSVINEPTAAAIAYGVDKKIQQKRNILVYDLGGGTFDVVILTIEDGQYQVRAVSGDTFLGGGDFDNRLVDHFVKEFQRKHKVSLETEKKALGKLRKACESAKRNLSFTMQESICVENILPGINFESRISRVRFEQLCSDLFQSTLEPVETVLRDSGLKKADIHEVVLAGGSTRIPKIRELLQGCFNGKKLNSTINPDEAVANGAAIHAAILSGESTVEEIRLLDVCPLSLGVNILGGRTSVIIKRNTKIPTERTERYHTTRDNQDAVDIHVYEGERDLSVHNILLGKFELGGIEIAKAGVAKIDVTFTIDTNGILTATAVDAKNKSEKSITITSNKGRLKKEELERMIEEAKDYKEDDNNKRLENIARNDLEAFSSAMKTRITDKKARGGLSAGAFLKIDSACDEALLWLEDNPSASREECEDRKKTLEHLAAQIISSC